MFMGAEEDDVNAVLRCLNTACHHILFAKLGTNPDDGDLGAFTELTGLKTVSQFIENGCNVSFDAIHLTHLPLQDLRQSQMTER